MKIQEDQAGFIVVMDNGDKYRLSEMRKGYLTITKTTSTIDPISGNRIKIEAALSNTIKLLP